MSNTYNICCDTCKVQMWYGQSNGKIQLSYRDDKKEPLVEFLLEHEGHDLHSYSDYAGDSHKNNSDNYEKIEYKNYLET